MVILIAVLQALPVYIAGVLLQDRVALWVAAIIMTLVAAFTGSEQYFFVDFAAIVVAFLLAYGKASSGQP